MLDGLSYGAPLTEVGICGSDALVISIESWHASSKLDQYATFFRRKLSYSFPVWAPGSAWSSYLKNNPMCGGIGAALSLARQFSVVSL